MFEPRNKKVPAIGVILRQLFINQASNFTDDVSTVEYSNATITITKIGDKCASIADELEDYISITWDHLRIDKMNCYPLTIS